MMLSFLHDDYEIETKLRVIIWENENDWLTASDLTPHN